MGLKGVFCSLALSRTNKSIMKKLLISLFILLMTAPVFAKIKAKHIAGTWTYSVQTGQGDLTGILKFTKEKKVNYLERSLQTMA